MLARSLDPGPSSFVSPSQCYNFLSPLPPFSIAEQPERVLPVSSFQHFVRPQTLRTVPCHAVLVGVCRAEVFPPFLTRQLNLLSLFFGAKASTFQQRPLQQFFEL